MFMSEDENEARARRFIQVWAPGNLSVLDELAAPDITVINPVLGEPVRGAAAFKQLLAHFHAACPDVEIFSGADRRIGQSRYALERVWHASRRIVGCSADGQATELDRDHHPPPGRQQGNGGARRGSRAWPDAANRRDA